MFEGLVLRFERLCTSRGTLSPSRDRVVCRHLRVTQIASTLFRSQSLEKPDLNTLLSQVGGPEPAAGEIPVRLLAETNLVGSRERYFEYSV